MRYTAGLTIVSNEDASELKHWFVDKSQEIPYSRGSRCISMI